MARFDPTPFAVATLVPLALAWQLTRHAEHASRDFAALDRLRETPNF